MVSDIVFLFVTFNKSIFTTDMTFGSCEVSRVRAMLLMSVAHIFFTNRPTILLLVYLPLNSINQHQDSDVKCV